MYIHYSETYFNPTIETINVIRKNIRQKVAGSLKIKIPTKTLPTAPIISQNSSNFYSLGINPFNNEIYVSDALDYTQRGKIFRYNREGILIHTFLADIIPGNIYFK